MLGIAVSEGKIPTLDARVVDYYPEMMEVKEGEGPKEERYAFEEDREITFRQLICNTSGYMKPGEQPGKHFHYQTVGMNIITIASPRFMAPMTVTTPIVCPGPDERLQELLERAEAYMKDVPVDIEPPGSDTFGSETR